MKTLKPILAKLIEKGWGASGYYSEEVLKRDGPLAFPQKTLMFLNHATKQQLRERPEGDMKDLAAVLISNPVYDSNGEDGPGLYALSKPFSDYAALISEKGPFTGLSIFAEGVRKWGKAEGREGYIVTEIKPSRLNSVDIVARAGANGRFLIESAPPQEGYELLKESVLIQQVAQEVDKKETVMDDESLNVQGQLREAQATISHLKEENTGLLAKFNNLNAIVLIERIMRDEYKGLTSPVQNLIKKIIAESLPIRADGLLDEEAVRERISQEAEPFFRESGAGASQRSVNTPPSLGRQATVYGHGQSSGLGNLLSEGAKAKAYLDKYLES